MCGFSDQGHFSRASLRGADDESMSQAANTGLHSALIRGYIEADHFSLKNRLAGHWRDGLTDSRNDAVTDLEHAND